MKPENLKIFIVEDDRFFAHLIKNQLEQHHYTQIEVFEDGESFLNHLYQAPDVVILDHHLGELNGLDVLRKIKAVNPNIQIIFFTGQERMDVAVNALKYGAYDYLIKNETNLKRLEFILKKIMDINTLIAERNASQRLKRNALIGLFVAAITLVTFIIN